MTTADTASRTGADRFARNAMIACAVISPLTIAAALLASSMSTTAEGEAYVRQFASNLAAYPLWAWISAIGGIAIIPALLGVGRTARLGRPALGLTGLVLAFGIALPVGANSDDVLYAAFKSGLDVGTTARLYSALENEVPTAPLGIVWFAGLVGLVIMGIAALLGKTAPPWAAITLIVAPVLVPIPWFTGMAAAVAAVPWLLLALGMGGVALGARP